MLAISELYSNNGYALASVIPNLQTDEQNKTVQVTLSISEGDKYKVAGSRYRQYQDPGQGHPERDTVDEGETFDSSKLKRSYERINNLDTSSRSKWCRSRS